MPDRTHVGSGKVRELFEVGDDQSAARGLGPHQRVRRRPAPGHPRQGQGPHRAHPLLARGHGGHLPQPLHLGAGRAIFPTSGIDDLAGPGDAVQAGRADRDRVRGARLPLRAPAGRSTRPTGPSAGTSFPRDSSSPTGSPSRSSRRRRRRSRVTTRTSPRSRRREVAGQEIYDTARDYALEIYTKAAETSRSSAASSSPTRSSSSASSRARSS